MKNRENMFKRQNQTQKTRHIMKNTRTIKMKKQSKTNKNINDENKLKYK